MSLSDLEQLQHAVIKRIQWCIEDNFTHPAQAQATHHCPVCLGKEPEHSPECELWHAYAAAEMTNVNEAA